MTQADDVRSHFAGCTFGVACTEVDIQRAESELGEPLPQILRELYLAFNGFEGPANSGFFWPLFAEGHSGLVGFNQFLRGDAELFPNALVSQCIFFGGGGGGSQWGINRDLPGKVIEWSAGCGEDFEIVGDSPIEVWVAEKKRYDEIDYENLHHPDPRTLAAAVDLVMRTSGATPELPLEGMECLKGDVERCRQLADLLSPYGRMVPILVKLLEDAAPTFRGMAASALGQLGPAAREAAEPLKRLLADTAEIPRSEFDHRVCDRAASALNQILGDRDYRRELPGTHSGEK